MPCLFCELANGNIPSQKVFENDVVVAFRDLHPQAPTHILVIPKKHVESFVDLGPEDGPLLMEMTLAIQAIARAEGLPEKGFRIVTNVGSDGGQSVFHLHFHILGGRRLTWPPG